jgi:hypothetical protein
MKYLILPTIIATLVCFLTYIFGGAAEDDQENSAPASEPNYLVTFLITFCVVAAISYVFSGDDSGQLKGGGGSLKAVMREISVGDPDF